MNTAGRIWCRSGLNGTKNDNDRNFSLKNGKKDKDKPFPRKMNLWELTILIEAIPRKQVLSTKQMSSNEVSTMLQIVVFKYYNIDLAWNWVIEAQ